MPTGELSDLALAEIGEADALDGGGDGLAIDRARSAQEIHVAVAPHHNYVLDADGEGPVHLLALRDVSDPTFALGLAHGGVSYRNAAGGRRDEAHEGLEEGGFTRAIDADEGANSPAGEGKGGVGEGSVAVGVSDGDLVGGEGEWELVGYWR